MNKSTKIRLGLMGFTAAIALAGCFGADNVASPGEGVLIGGGGSSSSSSSSSTSGVAAASCPTGTDNVGVITLAGGAQARNCQLPNTISGSLTLAKLDGVIYSVSGRVNVGVDQGSDVNAPIAGAAKGVLTIEPGVTVFGSAGLDYIAVQRGSQIFAEGTAANPIIFTSRNNVTGASTANSIGEWGGLVILGRAPTNTCPTDAVPATLNAFKDCTTNFEAVAGLNFGGNNLADNSGVLKYVQVRYTGYQVDVGKELNGITFAGVGAGTTVDYVQVYNSSDDGVEFFGGTVNAKHLVLYGNDDEQFDTDNTWSGSVQWMLAVQAARSTSGSFGFEMSCNKGGNSGIRSMCPTTSAVNTGTIRPFSYPKVSNATIIMKNTANTQALKLDTGTGLLLVNSIIRTTSASSNCFSIQDDNTVVAQIAFRSVYAICGGIASISVQTGTSNTGQVLPTQAAADALWTSGNITRVSSSTSVLLPTVMNNTLGTATTLTGDFINGANENAVAVTDPTILNDGVNNNVGFFTKPTNIGAVNSASETWYKGWTCGMATGEKSCQ
ncbi:hypothetical protein PQU92_12930 [Asticcacaulis sp. BYS171W]|uniref:Secreted protein n=1 Tax=Asticcacaulis aquaticus TaxID=2984212 RepID=A0ABT5HW82_9CAUL|nr:hypothetical protein [Asticcacaulis aquaticus]MDC7684188.1 hypothetical protein [Asticcacaulis aquaticus]